MIRLTHDEAMEVFVGGDNLDEAKEIIRDLICKTCNHAWCDRARTFLGRIA